MKIKRLLLWSVIAAVTAVSAEAKEKILVLNEGMWPDQNGGIDYLYGNEMISTDWYYDVNQEYIGITPNDIIQINDNLFAVAVNYSHKVVFIDASGKKVAELDEYDTPNCRHMATDGDYIYLTGYDQMATVWPDNGDTPEYLYWDEGGYVVKIDVNTFKPVALTVVGWEPEGVEYYGGKLFVANSGGYAPIQSPTGGANHDDYESTVMVIDPDMMGVDPYDNSAIERTIDVGHINLYPAMSINGKYLLINSAGDYYSIYPAIVVMDCQKVIDGEDDSECFAYNNNFASTYSCATNDGKFLAIGSAFSYDTMGYEYNYITIDPEAMMNDKEPDGSSKSGITAEMPGTLREDIMKFAYPYGIYQNPYSGYYYATDGAGATEGDSSGGYLWQWDENGNFIGKYGVGVFPSHILAVAPRYAKVTLTMNTVSTTAALISKETGEKVPLGDLTSSTYKFETDPGEYTLVAYNKNGEENGSIILEIADVIENQTFSVITPTIYATNSGWEYDKDYTLDVKVSDRAGTPREITLGNSVTAGRKTFLALSGDSYRATFVPSESRVAEGYTAIRRNGTLTFNPTISCAIPMSGKFSFSVPDGATAEVGMKIAHFVDFEVVEPSETVSADGSTRYTYDLAEGQVYSYRTSIEGGLTRAGYFTMNSEKMPEITFTDDSYREHDPKEINHDYSANNGYETGDIFVNSGECGFIKLNKGDTFRAHAMRSWQIIDGITNNYFIEPDFHYEVLDIDGNPTDEILAIEQNPGSAWADIKAIGNGTAIVLVTYDAVAASYYTADGEKKDFVGGEYWGAIWPENTAVYVVAVGQSSATSRPNMLMHDEINVESEKVCGYNYDAEHDVIYYLDTDDGCDFTFKPRNVSAVAVAYPEISEKGVSYTGFGEEIKKSADGTFTVRLREGRQIVRMTDLVKRNSYQVVTARPCHREIINLTREDGTFQPGDQIKIQYSGLSHPANKLAGIYNMSASVVYDDLPEGVNAQFGRAAQHNFASTPTAQSFTFTIPATLSRASDVSYVFDGGAIKVSGFGDPFGSHRLIDSQLGRSPNFTAVSHTARMGSLPRVEIKIGDTTGVDDINGDSASVEAYYNLQGIASKEPYDGFNIVRYSDGTVRKIHIKK